MMVQPQTLEEWFQYVRSIPDGEVLAKARAANTVMFVRTLVDEGMDPEDVEDILRMFAGRLRKAGIAIPSRYDGAYIDLNSL
jgi:hypothetical protein